MGKNEVDREGNLGKGIQEVKETKKGGGRKRKGERGG